MTDEISFRYSEVVDKGVRPWLGNYPGPPRDFDWTLPVLLRDGDCYMYRYKDHVTLEQVQSGEVQLWSCVVRNPVEPVRSSKCVVPNVM